MKKISKKSCISGAMFAFIFAGFSTTPILATTTPTNMKVENNAIENDLISIIIPYIVENASFYQLRNEDELATKIGLDKVISLKAFLVEASKEKTQSLTKEAVQQGHINVLEYIGCTMTPYWWGKMIKVPSNRSTAIKVRDLTSAFSGDAGTAGLAVAGIGAIPGLGGPATIAWADSTT